MWLYNPPFEQQFLNTLKFFFLCFTYMSRAYFIDEARKNEAGIFSCNGTLLYLLYFKLSYLDYFAWGKENNNDEFSSTSGA